MTLDESIENFSFLDEWEDRYLIELGRTLETLSQAAHTDANKVLGCASQAWLETNQSSPPIASPRSMQPFTIHPMSNVIWFADRPNGGFAPRRRMFGIARRLARSEVTTDPCTRATDLG